MALTRARRPVLAGFIIPELSSSTLLSPTPPISPFSQFTGAAKALLLGQWLNSPEPATSPAVQRARPSDAPPPQVLLPPPAAWMRGSATHMNTREDPASPSAQRSLLGARRGGLRRGASAGGLSDDAGKRCERHVSFTPGLPHSPRLAPIPPPGSDSRLALLTPRDQGGREAGGKRERGQGGRGAEGQGGRGERHATPMHASRQATLAARQAMRVAGGIGEAKHRPGGNPGAKR